METGMSQIKDLLGVPQDSTDAEVVESIQYIVNALPGQLRENIHELAMVAYYHGREYAELQQEVLKLRFDNRRLTDENALLKLRKRR